MGPCVFSVKVQTQTTAARRVIERRAYSHGSNAPRIHRLAALGRSEPKVADENARFVCASAPHLRSEPRATVGVALRPLIERLGVYANHRRTGDTWHAHVHDLLNHRNRRRWRPRRKRIRLLEVVRQNTRSPGSEEMLRPRHDRGDRDHVSRVLDELAGVTMIGMIIVRAMREDEIGVVAADEVDDLPAFSSVGSSSPSWMSKIWYGTPMTAPAAVASPRRLCANAGPGIRGGPRRRWSADHAHVVPGGAIERGETPAA